MIMTYNNIKEVCKDLGQTEVKINENDAEVMRQKLQEIEEDLDKLYAMSDLGLKQITLDALGSLSLEVKTLQQRAREEFRIVKSKSNKK